MMMAVMVVSMMLAMPAIARALLRKRGSAENQ
jgi:hypothetical protein